MNTLFSPGDVLNPAAIANLSSDLAQRDDYSLWEYELFASLNARLIPGTPEASNYLADKSREEAAETLEAIAEGDTAHTIEEFGDASWCLYALAASHDINLPWYVGDLLNREGLDVARRDPKAPWPLISGLDKPGLLNAYQETSVDRHLHVPRMHSLATKWQVSAQIHDISDSSQELTRHTDNLTPAQTGLMRNVLGWAAGDLWLVLARESSRAVGRPVVREALAGNIKKTNGRVASSYDFSHPERLRRR